MLEKKSAENSFKNILTQFFKLAHPQKLQIPQKMKQEISKYAL